MTVIMITVSTTEPTVYTRAKYSWKSPHFRSGPHDAGFPLPVLAQGMYVRLAAVLRTVLWRRKPRLSGKSWKLGALIGEFIETSEEIRDFFLHTTFLSTVQASGEFYRSVYSYS